MSIEGRVIALGSCEAGDVSAACAPDALRSRQCATEAFEQAMAPRENPRHPMFRDHNCWKCGNGEKPCAEGNYGNCSYPHARND